MENSTIDKEEKVTRKPYCSCSCNRIPEIIKEEKIKRKKEV